MPDSLNKKIIELENKFSILITKFKKLEAINENLKKEITDKEIDLILYKFNHFSFNFSFFQLDGIFTNSFSWILSLVSLLTKL